MAEGSREIDVIIIGGGPAGLTAAIYSAWLGLRTVVLEAGIVGGRAWLAPKIENFPSDFFSVQMVVPDTSKTFR